MGHKLFMEKPNVWIIKNIELGERINVINFNYFLSKLEFENKIRN